MVVRRRKKKNTLRGHRTHGKGDTKNKRGAGSRGGRGRAGSHKHKFTKYMYDFGKDKSVAERTNNAMNLDDVQNSLDLFVEKKLVDKKDDTFFFDGKKIGINKILSRGKIKSQIIFSNCKASQKAIDKILEAGGDIQLPEEKTIETKEKIEETK